MNEHQAKQIKGGKRRLRAGERLGDKGPQTGTGIGLFRSKTIMEKTMSGRLTVRNTADGAEFRIEV